MQPWKMRAADFYELLEKQDFRCYLSSRQLTPSTVSVVKIKQGEIASKKNICLVHEIVAGLARKWSIEQVREICKEITENITSERHNSGKDTQIRSKSKWQSNLNRVANFNKRPLDKKTEKPSLQTWAGRASYQITRINKNR